MKSYDLDAFERFMLELAECYGRAPYTTGALKQWADAFRDFDWRQVKAKLSVWRDNNPKIPQIGDILPSLKQMRDFERLRDEQKKPVLPTPVTAHGEACLTTINALLENPKAPGAWWAYELRDRHRAGEKLSLVQIELARKACGVDWDTDRRYGAAVTSREPGSDDE